MGRRPKLKPNLSKQVHGSELEEAKDAVAITIIKEVERQLQKRIENGDFNEMSAKDLLKELRGIFNATKKPNNTITAIQLPRSGQQPIDVTRKERDREFELAVEDGKESELLEAQDRYLEKHKE